jgi:peptide/nickel transport system ATP-binding protein
VDTPDTNQMSDPILDVKHLSVNFEVEDRLIKAVNDISFQVQRGQTLGIVGESGSGKSVTSLAVMGLVPNPPGKIVDGEIWLSPRGEGARPVDLCTLSDSQMRSYRGGAVSMIFQEPMSSLNPVYTCGFQMVEAIREHRNMPKEEACNLAINLLQEVKLLPSDDELRAIIQETEPNLTENELQTEIFQRKQAILNRYPHELSGGQIQRVMIAMAISCNPSLLIADEPTTALDVTVQATILDLLRELRDNRGMSLIFITHDLGIIAEIADQVAVMYQGEIVETGSVWEIFRTPTSLHQRAAGLPPPAPPAAALLPTVAILWKKWAAMERWQIRDQRSWMPPPWPGSSSRSVMKLRDPPEALTKNGPLLRVENLQVGYPVRGVFGKARRHVMAVNDVSFPDSEGRNLWLGGGIGLRQNYPGPCPVDGWCPALGGKIWFKGQDVLAALLANCVNCGGICKSFFKIPSVPSTPA